jgi:tetratricopeptide (TPR) repeat protein
LLRGLEFTDPGKHKLLLYVRAATSAAAAAAAPRLSAGSDAALVSSLADYRALARLEPDDVELRYLIAAQLLELGGYDESRAVQDEIMSKWPGEYFRAMIRIGAIHRNLGDYEQALRTLDEIVAKEGPQDGMRYNYHRGWTLSLLGRHEEAAESFTAGLAVQGDYTSAYVRRGCARARIGQLPEALADFEEGRRLLLALPGGAASPLVRRDVADLEADRARVAAAIAAGRSGPVTGMCEGDVWRASEKPRARSPLLPPA